MSDDYNLDDDVPDKATIKDGKRVITIRAIASDKDKDTEGITDYSKEELEEILAELATREFEKEKEALKKEFEARGLDTFAFDLVDSPSKLEKLREKLENAPKVKQSSEHYRKAPSGKVKMANYPSSQTDDVTSWYHKQFNSQKEMVDFLYDKLEHGTAKERKEAEKILNQMFQKLGRVGQLKIERGSEQ